MSMRLKLNHIAAFLITATLWSCKDSVKEKTLTDYKFSEKGIVVNCDNFESVFLQPVIPFLYGRKDCPTSPNTLDVRDFPLANFNHSQLVGFFDEEFGMSLAETIAIMGAHTVGGSAGSSGFIGLFTGGNQH